jgi:nitrate/nitrite transport system ATP-binding protein
MLLKLEKVSKRYGGVTVLRDINLEIGEGEFVAIVGASGSGKTTLLSLIAGLLKPDSGSISLRGRPIAGPGPDRGVVFQSYSLLPWRSVRANLSLAVDHVFPQWPKAKRRGHIMNQLELVQLTPAADKRPHELSSGMKQRVALARALSTEPEILLLDQPFGAVDALTRVNLQEQLLQVCEQTRKTVLLITSDIDEALLLADRIVPLSSQAGATLGASIPIPVPRPRDRKALYQGLQYKDLRLQVIESLAVNRDSWTVATETDVPAPSLRPVDLRNAGEIYSVFGIRPSAPKS